jgi:Wall-associated receptor kinase C-terminal
MLQNTSTPRVDHNVSLTPNTWLNYTDLVTNITFFLDCGKFPLNFTNSTISPADSMPGKYSYVYPTATIPSYYYPDWVKTCEEVVLAPVLGNKVNSQMLNLSAAYGSVLSYGFQLQWSDASDKEYCTQYEKKGCYCGYIVTSNSSYSLTSFCYGTYYLFYLMLIYL